MFSLGNFKICGIYKEIEIWIRSDWVRIEYAPTGHETPFFRPVAIIYQVLFDQLTPNLVYTITFEIEIYFFYYFKQLVKKKELLCIRQSLFYDWFVTFWYQS